MARLRIAFIVPYFLPAVGGIISHVTDLALKLANEGYEVEVHAAATYVQNKANTIREGCINIDRLTICYEREYVPILRQLRRVVLNEKVDIVHIHNVERMLLTRLYHVLKGGLKASIIVTLHGSLIAPLMNKGLLATLKRIYDSILTRNVLIKAKTIIALCKLEYTVLRDIVHIDEDKIVVIPNWIRETAFKKYAPSDRIKKLVDNIGGDYILTLARIDKNKNIESVVDTLRMLPRDVHYVIAGPDNGHLRQVMAKVQKLGFRHRVHYLGVVRGSDKYSLIRNALAVVIPSRFDFFPLVVLEAMAQGTPVIARKVGCIPEIVEHGKTGFLYNKDNELVRYIQLLYDDTSVRRNIGMNGSLAALNYTFSRIFPRIKQVYEEALFG